MKAKPVLLIIVTLIIGFILGMLTSAQVRYHRLKPVQVFFSEDRFRDGFYKTINPEGQQKAKIDLILDKYARINSELHSNFRKQLEASMRDFRKELDSNLTKDQLERLKVMDERRQEMIRRNRKSHQNDTTELRDERWHDHNRETSPEDHQPSAPSGQKDTTGLGKTK
jgi:hypothetical protein